VRNWRVNHVPSALARARGDASVKLAAVELGGQGGVELAVPVAVLELAENAVGLLDLLNMVRLTKLHTIVGLVPLLEGGRVDGDNGVLHEGLGADQLVVGSVVADVEDTALAGAGFRTPGEVTSLQTESAELLVATAYTDDANTVVGGELGVGRNTAKLVLLSLAPRGLATTGKAALMELLARNTWRRDKKNQGGRRR